MFLIRWPMLCGFIPALALILCSCDRPPRSERSQAEPSVVARVGQVSLDERTLRERLARRFPGFTPVQREALLEDWIRQEALYAKACASGFDREPELQARIKQWIISRYREAHLSDATGGAISAQEVARAYENDPGAFTSEAAVRAAVIWVAASPKMSADRRSVLRERAEAALKEARAAASDQAFAQVVQRYSDDQATRYRGGVSGWLKRSSEERPVLVVEALFGLQNPGDLTSVLETPEGFWIGRLLEHRKAERRPLAEVQEVIRHRLQQSRQQERERQFYERAKSGLEIWVNRPLLDSISAPENRAEPPALTAHQTAPSFVRP